MTITRRTLPMHPLLGRHVNHDDRSRQYAIKPTRGVLRSVRHTAHIGVLNQKVGACTGNSGISAIYHEPYYTATSKRWPGYPPTEAGAVKLYSQATWLDDAPGHYPPDDTGSDGLSIGKALKAAGIISGYLWAFTPATALQQLMTTPLLTGISWYNSMFETATGVLTVDTASGMAGGHELCVDEYIAGGTTKPALVGGPNSWGINWGDKGRWYMTVSDWAMLLADQGDVVALIR